MDQPAKFRSQPSLDEIVSQSAIVLADQIQKAAAWAKSEMDLQVEVAGALKDFARMAKIKPLEGHHNVTIATGRPDSVYGSVIVEYKDPGTLSPNNDAAPNKAVIEQLKRRFYDMNREERRNWSSMFGVGTDGKYFIFLRFRLDKWTDEEPVPVDRDSTRRFLWALYNLGQKGRPYLPEYLHGDFGSDSDLARTGVLALYEEITNTKEPKAEVFFSQWKILFGEVCGYDVENVSEKLNKLAEAYVVKGNLRPANLLFAVHTYYALLVKLVSLEIVYFYQLRNMPRHFERLLEASNPSKLRKGLEELELRGGIFHQLGITNFLEGDLFSWYLAVWTEPIQKLVRRMLEKLDEYNPGTISEDPSESRDLLKKLYQQLFPKSVRHDLGEYYTPDWLAEHVLNELGYEGDPDKRLLDPACGSGTFLVMAINRIRRWYDQNREKCSYDEGGLLERIQKNVVGFDLNPLAVMAARTNYLLAVRDLLPHVGRLDIPVYLCDSILTPREYGKLFDAQGNVMPGLEEAKEIKRTSVGRILVPAELVKDRELIGKYSELLHDALARGDTFEDFISTCDQEGLPTKSANIHKLLYRQLQALEGEKKNRIWARIIRNSFAPIFEGVFDFIVGNPPWVNWDSLPADYRDDTKDLWFETGLFSLSGKEGRLGGAKKDISTLMLYVAVDSYLRKAGSLAFLITQTIFKTKGAGDGFRRFRYGSSGPRMHVFRVDDFASFNPFEDASNWSSAVFLERDKETKPPVPYYVWELKEGVSPADVVPEKYRKQLSVRLEEAWPVDKLRPTSPWITGEPEKLSVLSKAIGPSKYKGSAGVTTWLDGVFWVTILREVGADILVENLPELAKTGLPKVQASVEKTLVYPFLEWDKIGKFRAVPSHHIIVPQDPAKRIGYDYSWMRKHAIKTFEYLQRFEDKLRKRSGFRRYFAEDDPFYSVYNVGSHTFAPIKVIYRTMGSDIRAAVLEPVKDRFLGLRPVIHKNTVISVPVHTHEEAHFLCAILNSAIVTEIANSYAVRGGKSFGSTNLLGYVRIAPFDAETALHRQLAELSVEAHVAAKAKDAKESASLLRRIDKLVSRLW